LKTSLNSCAYLFKPISIRTVIRLNPIWFLGEKILPFEHTRWLLSGVTLVISFYSPFLSGVPIMILTVLVMARNFTYGVAAKLGFAPDDYLFDF
jgi:hypothetical protein